MSSRVDLHNILVGLIGSNNVYFQPPSTFKMSYPCIVYARSDVDDQFADDIKYISKKRYNITAISTNPDWDVPDKIATLPYSSFATYFVVDNLNHDVYAVYF